jgi:hypothetical protein
VFAESREAAQLRKNSSLTDDKSDYAPRRAKKQEILAAEQPALQTSMWRIWSWLWQFHHPSSAGTDCLTDGSSVLGYQLEEHSHLEDYRLVKDRAEVSTHRIALI